METSQVRSLPSSSFITLERQGCQWLCS